MIRAVNFRQASKIASLALSEVTYINNLRIQSDGRFVFARISSLIVLWESMWLGDKKTLASHVKGLEFVPSHWDQFIFIHLQTHKCSA